MGAWRGQCRAEQRLAARAETMDGMDVMVIGGRTGPGSERRTRLAPRLIGAPAVRVTALVRLAHGL